LKTAISVAVEDNPLIGRCPFIVAVRLDESGRITVGPWRSLSTNASLRGE